MSVEEKRAELILKEAESHETAHVPERIQSHLSWPGLSQGKLHEMCNNSMGHSGYI